MRFRPTSLEIANFKSFGNTQTLDMDLPAGLHFIAGRNDFDVRLGSNGAGKSSLWDALAWVLFGRTIGLLRGTDITPWKGNGKPDVALHYTDNNGPHIIRRTIGPSRLLLDDKVVGQEDIEAAIGFSFELLPVVMLFGQAQPLFLDNSQAEQMNLLSDALHLQKWLGYSDKAKAKAGEVEGKALDLERSKARMEGELSQIKEAMISLKARQAEWLAGAKEKLDELADKCAMLAKDLELWESTVREKQLGVDAIGLKLKEHGEDQKRIFKEHTQAFRTLNDLKSDLDKATARQAELIRHRTVISKGKCPMCGQALASKRKEYDQHIADELKELEERIKGLEKQRDVAKAKMTTMQKVSDKAQGVGEELRAKLFEMEDSLRGAVAKATMLRSDLNNAADQRKAHGMSPYVKQLEDLRANREGKRKSLAELEKTLETARWLKESYSYWVGAFRNVRLHIISELLDELTITVNSDLPEVGMDGWEVHFSSEKVLASGEYRHALNLEIENSQGNAGRFASWSGGEGQRLRMVVSLALAECLATKSGLDLDLLVLDEPIRHLSPQGNADLIRYLAARAKRLGIRIFLTDHQSRQSSFFDSVTTVIKDGNGSRIAHDIGE